MWKAVRGMQRKGGFFDQQEGRALFGPDPLNYEDIRPLYPEQIYQFLVATSALSANISTLEIGPGTGLATRRLLDFGVNPLTLIEPDSRFSPFLTSLSKLYRAEIRIVEESFEDADLEPDHYDLVAAATSFHWIHPSIGLSKVADVLEPSGCVALWWNVFGDPDRADPYHEATDLILGHLPSGPSAGPEAVPFALDTRARLRDFSRTKRFDEPMYEVFRWTLVLNTQQISSLNATFSSISRLPEDERRRVLDQLMDVAERQFGGTVERNMTSPVYVARLGLNPR